MLNQGVCLEGLRFARHRAKSGCDNGLSRADPFLTVLADGFFEDSEKVTAQGLVILAVLIGLDIECGSLLVVGFLSCCAKRYDQQYPKVV